MTAPETATAILREEHVLILQVAEVLERILDANEHDLDFDAIAECVLSSAVCRCVPPRQEEDLLFPSWSSMACRQTAGRSPSCSTSTGWAAVRRENGGFPARCPRWRRL